MHGQLKKHEASNVNLDDAVSLQELRAALNDVLRFLRPIERTVLRLHFGLHDGFEYSLNDVSLIMCRGRHTVQQFKLSGLAKLRSEKISSRLQGFRSENRKPPNV